ESVSNRQTAMNIVGRARRFKGKTTHLRHGGVTWVSLCTTVGMLGECLGRDWGRPGDLLWRAIRDRGRNEVEPGRSIPSMDPIRPTGPRRAVLWWIGRVWSIARDPTGNFSVGGEISPVARGVLPRCCLVRSAAMRRALVLM